MADNPTPATTDDHGWTEIGTLADARFIDTGSDEGTAVLSMPFSSEPPRLYFGPAMTRHSCGCSCAPFGVCARPATQEDFLCDECRASCSVAANFDSEGGEG